MRALCVVLAVIACACAHAPAPSHHVVEPDSNAVSVWDGAFRINGGSGWTLGETNSSGETFRAAYRSTDATPIACRFHIETEDAGDASIEQLNARTRAETQTQYANDSRGAHRISELSERQAGAALVMVWDFVDAEGVSHVVNRAFLRPVDSGRTLSAVKHCSSAAPLDASNAAINGLRAEFNFQAPYWSRLSDAS